MTSRNQTILDFLPYVKQLSDTICYFQGVGDPFIREDCRSAAVESLILAVDSYDPECGASLKTWITRQVKWAIQEFFRGFFGRKSQESDFLNEERENFRFSLSRLGYTADNLPWDEMKNRLACSTNGVEDDVYNNDLVDRILSFVDKRDHGCNKRDNLLKRLIEGMTTKEISELRNCTRQNISFLISGVISDINKSHFRNEYFG